MSLRPETFEDDLQRRLGRHYRLRWSADKDVWCIEHGVEVPLAGVPNRLRGTDTWIRARDRQWLVCEVSPTPELTCPHCRVTRLRLPVLKWAEVKCGYCARHPYKPNVSLSAAYFPLGDRLLTHLESTALHRMEQAVRDMLRENARKREAQDRDDANYHEAGLLDYRNIIGGNLVIGAGKGPATFGAGHRH